MITRTLKAVGVVLGIPLLVMFLGGVLMLAVLGIGWLLVGLVLGPFASGC